ncbi:thiamine phosphate synthase [Fusobacterium sp. HC1336]|uniref:thiamine phosphate synthase n=1 Tax=Fusobacterium sp. HC1336 TaxID=3171169 RepID=UPI003F1FF44E
MFGNGVTIIQLREKTASKDEFLKLAKEVKGITDKYSIPLIINDNVEIAKAIDADGVHCISYYK